MSTLAEAIKQAAQTFTGALLQPTDAEYSLRRHVHNGLIDKHPAAIACCHGAADVADAVKLARMMNLEVAVRGGGHNVAGRATIDKGLMIDLSPMKGIYVDVTARPSARRAVCCGRNSIAKPSSMAWPQPAALSGSPVLRG